MGDMSTKRLVIRNIGLMKELSVSGKEESLEFSNLLNEILPCIKGIIWKKFSSFESLRWMGNDELESIGLEVFWDSYTKYNVKGKAQFLTYFITGLSNKYLGLNWEQSGRPYRVSNKDKNYMKKCKVKTPRYKKLETKIEGDKVLVGKRLRRDNTFSLSVEEGERGVLDKLQSKENITKNEGVEFIIDTLWSNMTEDDKDIFRELYLGCENDRMVRSRAIKYIEKLGHSYGSSTYALRQFTKRLKLEASKMGIDTSFVFRN